MTSSEILLFVKEEVAKHGDGKPSSLVIQAIREACLNLVSSKAAEAPGGQDCDCVIEIDSSRTATVIHQAGCRYSQLYEAFRRACEQVWRCTDAPGQTLESTMQFYLAAPAAPSERAEADVSSPAFYARRGPHCPTCGSFQDMPPNACADPFHATPSLSEERERFERVAEVYGWSATLYGTERIRENYLDYTLQRRWEGWQARAGLSSQEGK